MDELRFARRKRNRKTPARVDSPKEHVCNCFAAALTWIPRLDDGAHTIEPWHRYRVAALEYDEVRAFAACIGRNERVLTVG